MRSEDARAMLAKRLTEGQARAWMHRDRMTRQGYLCAQLSLRRKMGFKRKALVPVFQPNALRLGIADPFITRPLQCSPLNTADRGGTQNKGYKRGGILYWCHLFSCISMCFVAEYSYLFPTPPKMSFLQFLLRSITLSRPTFLGAVSLALQHEK